jgi:hypothetical protein
MHSASKFPAQVCSTAVTSPETDDCSTHSPRRISLPTPSIPRNTTSSALQSPSAGRLSTLFRQRRVQVVPQSPQGFRGSGLRRRLHRHVHRPVLWAVCFLNRTRGALALNQLCCSSSAAPRSGDAGRWAAEAARARRPFRSRRPTAGWIARGQLPTPQAISTLRCS